MNVETSEDHLRITVDLAAPIARAWAALTSPTALTAWWGDYVSLDSRLGGQLVEKWDNGAGREIVTSGVVTRFDPPRVLALTWSDDDWPAETQVEFTLQEQSAGPTRLTLEHSNWKALTGQDTRRLIANHAAGWRHHLESLRSYLDD